MFHTPRAGVRRHRPNTPVGYRLTGPRLLVWTVLEDSHHHLTAEQIAEIARERDPSVNLSSIYRSLALFDELGLVRESSLGTNSASHWEIAHPDEQFHLRCVSCGKIEHHQGDLVDQVRSHLSEEHGFQATDVELLVSGLCQDCTAAVNAWSQGPLGFKTTREYQSIGRLGADWDWRIGGRDANAYLNVTPYLGQALRENSHMRIFVGQGYYDFATPFFAAEYALSRTGIPQDRIVWSYYQAGHMMYVRDEDRSKLSADLREFIRGR